MPQHLLDWLHHLQNSPESRRHMHKRDRKLHQQKLRRDRIRRNKHLTRTAPQDAGLWEVPDLEEGPEEFDLPPAALAHPFIAEQSLYAMHQLLEGKDFSNIDE